MLKLSKKKIHQNLISFQERQQNFAGKPVLACPASRLALGEVSDYGLSRDKALRKLAAAILFSAKVVGGKSTAMDSKGNKVLVCDNGTGVRSISCYTVGNAVCK